MLDELEHTERDEARRAEQKREQDELDALHCAAYIDGLEGDVFFKSLFVEDTDGDKISLMPDVPDMLKE